MMNDDLVHIILQFSGVEYSVAFYFMLVLVNFNFFPVLQFAVSDTTPKLLVNIYVMSPDLHKS